MKFEFNAERAKHIAKQCAGIVIPVLMYNLCTKFGLEWGFTVRPSGGENREHLRDEYYYNGDMPSAVKAISNSDMYSYDKSDAIEVVSNDGDYDYYKSIIAIALAKSMSSSSKRDAIQNLTPKTQKT